MALAVIYDTQTGQVMSLYRDDDKDFARMKENKPLLEGQAILEISHLNVPDFSQFSPGVLEVIQRHVNEVTRA